MKQFNIHEAEINFFEIVELLEKNKETYIIISQDKKPLLKISLYDEVDRSSLFGAGKNMFEIPENFDDIDLQFDDCFCQS